MPPNTDNHPLSQSKELFIAMTREWTVLQEKWPLTSVAEIVVQTKQTCKTLQQDPRCMENSLPGM